MLFEATVGSFMTAVGVLIMARNKLLVGHCHGCVMKEDFVHKKVVNERPVALIQDSLDRLAVQKGKKDAFGDSELLWSLTETRAAKGETPLLDCSSQQLELLAHP